MKHSPHSDFARLLRQQGMPVGPRPVRLPGEGFARRVRPHRARRLPMFIVPAALMAFLGTWIALDRFEGAPVAGAGIAAASDRERAWFSSCVSGGGSNCVVDGDTFRYGGEKIRIADIDTPETHPARCAEEAAKGAAATARLRALLNAGPFTLEPIDRDTDRYGRKLRIVTRAGRSIGDRLVDEGLARPWEGSRRPWC